MNGSEIYFSKPKVSAAIVTYNKKESVLDLLTFLEELDIPTFVTDNGSTDGTREDIRDRFKGVSLLEADEYLGKTGGLNCAMLAALSTGSDYIVLLDDDIMPERDCINKLSCFLDTHEDYVFATPLVLIEPEQDTVQKTDAGNADFSKKIPADALESYQNGSYLLEFVDIEYTSACCLIIRADAVLSVGVMNWKHFTLDVVADWCFRLRQAFGKGACVTTAKAYQNFQWSKPFIPIKLYYNLYLKAKFWRELSETKSLRSTLTQLNGSRLYSSLIGDFKFSGTSFHILSDTWHKRHGMRMEFIQSVMSTKKLDKSYFMKNRIKRVLIDSYAEEYIPELVEAITECGENLTLDILCDADRVEKFREKKLFSKVYGRSNRITGILATYFMLKMQRYDLIVTDSAMDELGITCMAGKHSGFYNNKSLFLALNRPFMPLLFKIAVFAGRTLLSWLTYLKFSNTPTLGIPSPKAKPLLEKIGVDLSKGQPWSRVWNTPFAPSPHFSPENSELSSKNINKHMLRFFKDFFGSFFPRHGIEKKIKYETFYNSDFPSPFLGLGETNRGYDKWCWEREVHAPSKYHTRYHKDDPLFSILVPVCDPPADWLQECIVSVRSQNYGKWELILSDDGSTMEHVLPILEKAALSDLRIHRIESKERNGISAATNRAAEKASGEYLVFLDHDDILDSYALTAFAQTINENKKNRPADILYSDEDQFIDEKCFDHKRIRLFRNLKPKYSPDLLLATNYIHHPVVIRRDLFTRLKGLRSMYDGSQDHDLLLRAEEDCNQILHIPDILYHMRKHPDSLSADPQAKPEAYKNDRLLIAETMKRRGIVGTVSPAPEGYPGHSVIKRRMPENISVSVLVIPDGSSDMNEAPGYWEGCQVLIGQYDTTVAEQINALAKKAEAEVLIIASSEIRPDDEWKEAIVPHVIRNDIGLVTGKISYHDRKLYSCGLTLAVATAAERWHHGWPSSDAGYGGWLAMDHEVSAVPWQFMGVRRSLFLENGLLDTAFKFKGFDVDLALRLTTQLNLRHLAIPTAKVNFVQGYQDPFKKWDSNDLALLWTRWGLILRKGDPYLNPNFSVLNEEVRILNKKENDLRLRGCFVAYDDYTANLLHKRFHFNS